METKLLERCYMRFEHQAVFTTLNHLEEVIQMYLHQTFQSLTHCWIDYDGDGIFSLYLDDDEDYMDDVDIKRFNELIGNPQEEIENFKTVIELIFGKTSFVEFVDEDNINVFKKIKTLG